MADYDIRKLQLRLLDILKALDKVAKEHGLTYTLCGGTLLGAVRHKGFIPWDDDLDVSMPRPDYERLIAHAKEWLPEHYELICAENDPKYPLPFAKIQDARTTLIERRHLYYLGGCYIDIFPYDAFPTAWLPRWWACAKYRMLKVAQYQIHRDPYKHGHGPSSWLPLAVRKLTTMESIQRRIRKILTACDYDKARYVASYTDGMHGVLPREITTEYTEWEFEGQKFPGHKHYQEYLTNMYGPDFMTPPPMKDRWQHNFHYLDLDHSYRDYREQ